MYVPRMEVVLEAVEIRNQVIHRIEHLAIDADPNLTWNEILITYLVSVAWALIRAFFIFGLVCMSCRLIYPTDKESRTGSALDASFEICLGAAESGEAKLDEDMGGFGRETEDMKNETEMNEDMAGPTHTECAYHEPE